MKPSFSVIYVDPVMGLPIKFETYSVSEPQQKWKKEFSMTKSFGIKNLSPESLYNYAFSLLTNEQEALHFLKLTKN
jgi:hypothetical protein